MLGSQDGGKTNRLCLELLKKKGESVLQVLVNGNREVAHHEGNVFDKKQVVVGRGRKEQ